MQLIALILAAIAGLLMAVQGTINSALSKVIGLVGATFIVHLVGLVVIGVILLISLKGDHTFVQNALQAPWYSYLGGILSVMIIYAVASSISKVGATAATTAIIVGQVSTASFLDNQGLLGLERIPFTWLKAVGLLLLAGGAWLLLRR